MFFFCSCLDCSCWAYFSTNRFWILCNNANHNCCALACFCSHCSCYLFLIPFWSLPCSCSTACKSKNHVSLRKGFVCVCMCAQLRFFIKTSSKHLPRFQTHLVCCAKTHQGISQTHLNMKGLLENKLTRGKLKASITYIKVSPTIRISLHVAARILSNHQN